MPGPRAANAGVRGSRPLGFDARTQARDRNPEKARPAADSGTRGASAEPSRHALAHRSHSSEVSLHRDDFFPREKVVHERDMIVSKTATVHWRLDPHETIRVTVPGPEGGVPGYRRAPRHGRGPDRPQARRARWNRPQVCRSSKLAAWGLETATSCSDGVDRQSSAGAMISANEFRARFSRDFTVPRLQDVISAISSYDFPSSSRRMNTCL